MSLPNPTAPEVLSRLRQAAVSAESETERLERECRMTEWLRELLPRLRAERSARQRRRTRWSVGAVGLSLAAALAALYLGRWVRPSPSLGLATVTLVSGTVVTVDRAGNPAPSYAGQRLGDGDRIRVGHGEGALLLRNGARARLAASTSVTVTKSGRLPNEERLALELGTAAFLVPKLAAGHILTVVTAQVEVRVVGTRFSVTAENGGKTVAVRSCVAVSEGRVRLRRGTAE
ncbi:MAG: FecR domain-containing protein, partial [Polyangiaceae bacterium]|nr:FecR domain-containing protein [Polyangiaceae bacterium]